AYSRPPGAYPYELVTRVLSHVGGSVAVDLGSLVMGFVVLAGVAMLLRDDGRPAVPVVVLIAASPWWWIATTSLGDFVWALAAVVVGAVLARRDQRIWAGAAFGFALGFRASSILLVAAWLVAEQTGADRRPDLRDSARTAIT